ncbi:unnamed protein product [Musa acuminata subsp. malaccensis]|uniref:(wild Malaysian banana) hypothetical protein n=1 Tax=Musa acuminata subsp. malaccensis TaxID=214687 RepID=A0A8D7F1H3_MUSAM|nr:unnamed protein product [Musa acuminata subsp. malaccensis]
MTEKVSTLIIEADIGCSCCYKKIQKLLCKLQVRERILSINYNEKDNKVTISGPFNPECLKKKLLCKLCKVAKDIKIKPDDPPPPPPKPTKEPKEPVKIICCFKPWPDCCFRPCPCFEPSKGCRRCCFCGWMCCAVAPFCAPEPKPSPPKETKLVCCGKPWPSCCYKPCPCFEQTHGCRRCCSCGWMCCVRGPVCVPPPNPCPSCCPPRACPSEHCCSKPSPPPNPCFHGYKFVYEEGPPPDPCTIM